MLKTPIQSHLTAHVLSTTSRTFTPSLLELSIPLSR
jgi:hypothetical protein